jgi:hypothetical protein
MEWRCAAEGSLGGQGRWGGVLGGKNGFGLGLGGLEVAILGKSSIILSTMAKDTDSPTSSKPTSFIRRHKVAVSIASAVVLLIVLAYGMPVLVGDGVGKFTGIKRQVAERTLQNSYSMEDRMSRAVNRLNLLQYYIEDVWEMPVQDVKQYCRLSDGDDGTGYYYASVSQVTLFGLKISRGQTNTYEACSTGRIIKNTP